MNLRLTAGRAGARSVLGLSRLSDIALYYSHNFTQLPQGDPTYRSRYWEGPSTPLYRFGYGLSYATFSVADLRLTRQR